MLEELTDKPVLGVLPMLDIDVDDEDSLSERLSSGKKIGLVDIAVIRLPRLSNFTDFNPLERMEEVSLRYVSRPKELGNPDVIILPGTKNTLDDLRWLRESGLETLILKHASRGGAVVGICGGYQMLGRTISDPQGVEGGGMMHGLNLLPEDTVFYPEKTRKQVEGEILDVSGIFEPMIMKQFEGYEIHMGQTGGESGVFAKLDNGAEDGAWNNAACGSYVHGLFDEGTLAERFIGILLERKGLSFESAPKISFYDYKQREYDKLADVIRQNLDMDSIYKIIEKGI